MDQKIVAVTAWTVFKGKQNSVFRSKLSQEKSHRKVKITVKAIIMSYLPFLAPSYGPHLCEQ